MTASRTIQNLMLLSQAFLLASRREIESCPLTTQRMKSAATDEDCAIALRLHEELDNIRHKSGTNCDDYMRKSILLNDAMLGISLRVLKPEFIGKKLQPKEDGTSRNESLFHVMGATNHASLCQYQPEPQ